MGELHNVAMRDMLEHEHAWRGNGPRTLQSNCAIAWRIAQKYAPIVAQRTGKPFTNAVELRVRAVASQSGCDTQGFRGLVASAPSGQMSIFGVLDGADGVTGAYEPYATRLQNESFAGVASPRDVATRSRAIVDQASADGIPQPDLELLAGLASIAVASAEEWYDYESVGGFGGSPGRLEPSPAYSIFLNANVCTRWCVVGWSDLGGADVGAWGGGPAGAVVGGAVASVVAGLSSM